MDLRPDSVIVAAPGVLSAEVGGEIVLLDSRTGIYFGLNEVGASVWGYLENGCAVDEIGRCLVQEYEVSEDIARRDVNRLLSELLASELVQLADGPRGEKSA